MWTVADKYRVRFGGNTYINTGTLIEAHGAPLLTVKRSDDGYLAVDFDIFDATGQNWPQ
jgi:hypothetical protein